MYLNSDLNNHSNKRKIIYQGYHNSVIFFLQKGKTEKLRKEQETERQELLLKVIKYARITHHRLCIKTHNLRKVVHYTVSVPV